MKLIAPVIIGSEPLDWEEPELLALLSGFFRVIARVRNVSSRQVVTDSLTLVGLAEAAGLDVHLTDAIGSMSSIHQWGNLLEGKGDDVVCLVDYRFTGLTAGDLEAAMERFVREPNKPVLSIRNVVDNPVQYREGSFIVDSGFLYLFDSREAAERCEKEIGERVSAVSMPLSLDWDIFFGPMAGNDLLYTWPGGYPAPEKPHGGKGTAWLKLSDSTARLLWYGIDFDVTTVGAMNSVESAIKLKGCPEGLYVTGNEDLYITLLPVCGSALLADRVVEGSFDGGRMPLAVIREGVYSFAYVLERVVHQGYYDFERKFSPDNKAWNPESGTLPNGDNIYGRQKYPAVFEATSAFLVAEGDQLQRLDLLLAEGAVIGQRIGNDVHGPLQTRLDFLRHTLAVDAGRGNSDG